MFTTRFWKAAAERAIKTTAQSLIAILGAGSVHILTVDWSQAVGVSLTAGLLSVLTSVASAKVTHHDDPSLV